MALIMPAFMVHPDEAAVIGRLLAGYGESEYYMAMCARNASDEPDIVFRTIFRVRGEEQRILIADALMREKYIDIGLEDSYRNTIAGMYWCKNLRNQYAHCHWATHSQLGLRFTNMGSAAKKNDRPMMLTIHGVDLPLLGTQEEFFAHMNELFWYLDHEYQLRAGKLSSHTFALPPAKQPPPQYNP